MSIRAEVDNKFIRRYLFIALGGLAFMLWGAYDGFVVYPHELEMSEAYEEIKEAPDSEEQWLRLAEANGWPKTKPVKTPKDLRGYGYFQYFVTAAGALMAVFFMLKFLKTRGTWMEGDEKKITTSWGKSLDVDSITKINKQKWEKKGIARVHFEDVSGSEQIMVFDDFKYDRDNMSKLMSICETNLKPEQIVGGKTESQIAIDKKEAEAKKRLAELEAEAEESEA